MNTLYVMDPLSSLNLAGDSTFMLMLEGTRRGYASAWCTPADLYAREGAVAWARCQAVGTFPVDNDGPHGFETGDWREVPLTDFDVIWMRKDPPFDMSYIFCTYLLEMAVTGRQGADIHPVRLRKNRSRCRAPSQDAARGFESHNNGGELP